jgi:uncharacterized protein with HEPN domain
MARPLQLIVEEMLDYIEQAEAYVQGMSFEQYSSDQKTQRAVERCIEVISEASRHIPDEAEGKHPQIPWSDVAGIGNIFRPRVPQGRRPDRLGHRKSASAAATCRRALD